jgi:hypothetical protein
LFSAQHARSYVLPDETGVVHISWADEVVDVQVELIAGRR